jgi:hypothetical protein
MANKGALAAVHDRARLSPDRGPDRILISTFLQHSHCTGLSDMV